MKFYAKHEPDLHTGRSAKTRIFPAYPHYIPVFQFLFVFMQISLRSAAHNFLKLTEMKKHLKNTEKTFWQEFCDYLSTIYWPEAEENLPQETIDWEYRAFKQMMAH